MPPRRCVRYVMYAQRSNRRNGSRPSQERSDKRSRVSCSDDIPLITFWLLLHAAQSVTYPNTAFMRFKRAVARSIVMVSQSFESEPLSRSTASESGCCSS